MYDCNAAPFPFLSGISLEEGKSTPPMDSTIYCQLIGSLLYLTHLKPDICYAMNVVSIYMQQPNELHWKASKRMFQYIQGTRSYNIHYAADSELELVGFTDSDWVGDSIDRKSNFRYVFMFGGGPICQSSKKQGCHCIVFSRARVQGSSECLHPSCLVARNSFRLSDWQ